MKMSSGKNTKDHNLRKSGGKQAAKNLRREEAIARNNAWVKLSDEEKIIILAQRPGSCFKQITRIAGKLHE